VEVSENTLQSKRKGLSELYKAKGGYL